jgi:protein SCO1/2
MNLPPFSILLLLVLSTLLPAGCWFAATPAAEIPPAHEAAASAGPAYQVRGRIVEMRGGGEVLVAHEAIPGYMAAMTMPFVVDDPAWLDGLAPGDAVAFRYAAGASRISAVTRLDEAEAATLVLSEAPAYAEPSDESLYLFDALWTDQEGRRVRLVSLGGRPIVLAMVFTHCAYACPLTVHDMKRIGAGLSEDLRDEVRYVLVSLDPERDTPPALRRFAGAYGLDDGRWTLLRGTSDDVRMLAALLGVRYRKQSDGQFAHTNLITILNRRGEVVHRQKGLGAGSDAPVGVLETLLADAP